MKHAIALVLLFVVGCDTGDFALDAGAETVDRSYAIGGSTPTPLTPTPDGPRTDVGCAVNPDTGPFCCSRDGGWVCCCYAGGNCSCHDTGTPRVPQ
jgi:hypothetical protein